MKVEFLLDATIEHVKEGKKETFAKGQIVDLESREVIETLGERKAIRFVNPEGVIEFIKGGTHVSVPVKMC